MKHVCSASVTAGAVKLLSKAVFEPKSARAKLGGTQAGQALRRHARPSATRGACYAKEQAPPLSLNSHHQGVHIGAHYEFPIAIDGDSCNKRLHQVACVAVNALLADASNAARAAVATAASK